MLNRHSLLIRVCNVPFGHGFYLKTTLLVLLKAVLAKQRSYESLISVSHAVVHLFAESLMCHAK